MKKNIPWILSATLLVALIASWTGIRKEEVSKPIRPDFQQFAPWVYKCPAPWWTKAKMLEEYKKDPKPKAHPLIFNIMVYSSQDRGNKLLAYKKPDSAWVVLDPVGAVDYLASLSYEQLQEKTELQKKYDELKDKK